MLTCNKTPDSFLSIGNEKITCFNSDATDNIDQQTVESLGEEWKKFDEFKKEEIEKIGDEYFDIVPEAAFDKDKLALDVGCGQMNHGFMAKVV